MGMIYNNSLFLQKKISVWQYTYYALLKKNDKKTDNKYLIINNQRAYAKRK
jgi:hypothetical protein